MFLMPRTAILVLWLASAGAFTVGQGESAFSQVDPKAETIDQRHKFVRGSEQREDEIDILDFMLGGNVYQVGSAREGFRPKFLPDFGHEGIRLIDLRMLAFDEVQKELEITDKQLGRLQPLFADAHEYDSVWKHELACRCVPLRNEAYEGTAEFRRQINDEQAVINLLTEEQAARLRQLERRFASMALAETPGDVGKKFFSYFGFDSKLGLQIKAMLRDEFEAIASENKDWEDGELSRELQRLFDPAQLELLREVADEGRFFSRQPLLRTAQMAPFFRFSEIEKRFKNKDAVSDEELDFELIKPLILGNGRMVSFEDYYNRSRLSFGYSKWQRLILLIKESKSEWFSLIDSQSDALGKLVVTQESTEGAICYQFEGDQKIIDHNKAAPLEIQTSAKAYRGFNEESFILQKELDDHIRRSVELSMTPRQLDMLQFAIGATQHSQVGLFISLSENLLGKEFELSDEQQKRFQKLIQKRRAHEIERLNGVEEKVLSLMEREKRELFHSKFGETTNLFPSFFHYLARVLPEE